jgi:hypothetical protein
MAAGVNRARAATERGVWAADSGLTSEDDRGAIVFNSGPYPTATAAHQYAHLLQVVEIAASGARGVASAGHRSHLDAAVQSAAACMAAGS